MVGGGSKEQCNGCGGGGTGSPKVLQFEIASDANADMRKVKQQIMAEVKRCGFCEDDAFAIHLALEEAMINAAKHGNNFDPSKKIHIAAKISPSAAEFTIEDEGGGFSRSCVPDPRLEENLEKSSGRGLLLIESYMNRVEYTCGGRKLHMVKQRENGVH